MIDDREATRRGKDWVDAWNRRNLEEILAHYADDVEFSSPFVAKLEVNPGGVLKGIAAVREYFAKGLATFPDLRFEFFQAFAGADTVAVYYRSVRNLLAVEVHEYNGAGKIARASALYREEV